jgi:hypothetical protein
MGRRSFGIKKTWNISEKIYKLVCGIKEAKKQLTKFLDNLEKKNNKNKYNGKLIK